MSAGRIILWTVVMTASLSATPALAEEPDGDAPPDTGRARREPAERGTQLEVQAKLGSGLAPLTGLTPSLYVGARFGRMSLLLGASVTRGSESVTQMRQTFDNMGRPTGMMTVTEDVAATIFHFSPTLTVDLLRTSDDKVALYALAGVLLGGANVSDARSDSMDTSGCNSQTAPLVGYQVALGARMALHPNFRIGLEAGPQGTFLLFSNDSKCSSSPSSGSAGITTFYGALVGSFVW